MGGIQVAQPWLTGPVGGTPNAVALTPAAVRTEFEVLVSLRQGLQEAKTEPPVAAFVSEQIRMQLGSTNAQSLTADAVARLLVAIQAEVERRKDAETARKTLLRSVDKLIETMEADYPHEAVEVWKVYLAYIKKQNDVAKELAGEIDKTSKRIKKLQNAAKKKV